MVKFKCWKKVRDNKTGIAYYNEKEKSLAGAFVNKTYPVYKGYVAEVDTKGKPLNKLSPEFNGTPKNLISRKEAKKRVIDYIKNRDDC